MSSYTPTERVRLGDRAAELPGADHDRDHRQDHHDRHALGHARIAEAVVEDGPRRARPSSSATRLTGVTRSRSITPMRSSAIRLKPTPAAPNMPSCTSRPGTNTL